jgi:hypothetical protein
MEKQAPSQQTTLVASTGSSTSAPRPTTAQQPPTDGSGSGDTRASSAPSSRSHRSKRGGKCDGFGQQNSGQPAATGMQSGGQPKAAGSGSRGAPWPSFYNPWAGSIQMWPRLRPPLAPLPVPQQQALLAQPVPQQQAPAVESAGQWAAPPPGFPGISPLWRRHSAP